MQNTFLQMQDGKVIIDQAQLTTYAVAAAAVILLVVIITIAIKGRNKPFIKTVPTNLKRRK
jgi:hypothetical protein